MTSCCRTRCGWASTASTATGSTGWSTSTPRSSAPRDDLRDRLQPAPVADGPDDDEGASDEVPVGDLGDLAVAAVLGSAAVVAHDEHVRGLDDGVAERGAARCRGDHGRVQVGLVDRLAVDLQHAVLVGDRLPGQSDHALDQVTLAD